MSLEGFPKPEQVENAIDRAAMLVEGQRIWKALEDGSVPMVSKDPTFREGVIESLEFLKEKNNLTYTPEQKEAQYKKVDAFIETLRGESNDQEETEALDRAA